jgi:hypothetical protein
MHVGPPYAWVFFGVLCGYLASVMWLIQYLRRFRSDLWKAPYDTGVGRYVAIANWALMARLIFWLGHGRGSDTPLKFRLWSVRALLAITLILMTVGIVTHELPTR